MSCPWCTKKLQCLITSIGTSNGNLFDNMFFSLVGWVLIQSCVVHMFVSHNVSWAQNVVFKIIAGNACALIWLQLFSTQCQPPKQKAPVSSKNGLKTFIGFECTCIWSKCAVKQHLLCLHTLGEPSERNKCHSELHLMLQTAVQEQSSSLADCYIYAGTRWDSLHKLRMIITNTMRLLRLGNKVCTNTK